MSTNSKSTTSGNNQFGFNAGDAGQAGDTNLAGLTGVNSGVDSTMQQYGNTGLQNQYEFKMPDVSSSGLNSFASAASQIKPAPQQQQQMLRGGGGVRLPAKDFESGLTGPLVGGSSNGTTLLKLLQAAGQLK